MLFISILVTTASIKYTTAQCDIDDWTALKELYNSTNGDNWTDNTNWNIVMNNPPPTDCDLSHLAGVQTDLNGRVFEINLYNNNLNGILPQSIENLTHLKNLYLGNDEIAGEIPSGIGNLSSLEILSISDCEISGSIPSTFANLINLKVLYLYNNQLVGSIPSFIGSMTALEFLYLQNNQLTSTLPPEMANLTNLRRLYISGNQIEGCYPANWNTLCNQLTYAFISEGNNLDTSWSSFCSVGIGVCPTVQQQCNFADWEALKAFYNSTNGNNWIFDTNWNITNATSPPPDCDLSELYGVEMNSNGRVSEIVLFSNNLTGTLPHEIGLLSELNHLYLDYNQITSSIPHEIESLTNLLTLSIANNQLTGIIPSSINNLNNLTKIYLSNNQLSGSIPTELSSLTNLETLFLYNNQLSGNIPASFSQLASLANLHLGFNQLTGCFDESLTVLCNQLQFTEISNGNSFDATWEGFCQSQAGSCTTLNSSNVWPGDVNFDGIVNGLDIMHLGNYLYLSNDINPKLNPGADWLAYERTDWGVNQHAGFCFYGFDDLKHADCDGNGIIDFFDYQVILQNWGNAHNDAITILPAVPCFFFDDFSDYELTMQPIGKLDTNLIAFNIALANQQELVSIRSGFLNISYYNPNGSSLMGAAINLSHSWLGKPNLNLWYHDVFIQLSNKLEMGFTKTDLNNSVGEGIIGQVIFLLDDMSDTTNNNIADFEIELGFQNSDTTSVFLRDSFKVDLGNSICENNLIVTKQIPLKNEYVSFDSLHTQGNITIYKGQSTTYKALNRISLNEGFNVAAGATFKAFNEACD